MVGQSVPLFEEVVYNLWFMILFEPNSTDHCYSINIFIWICKMFCRSREFGKSEVFIVGTFHIQCGKRFIKHGCIQRIFFNSCCYSFHLQFQFRTSNCLISFDFFLLLALAAKYKYKYMKHDEVMWKYFPRHWPFVKGMRKCANLFFCFFSMNAWTNCWTNSWVTSDFRRH